MHRELDFMSKQPGKQLEGEELYIKQKKACNFSNNITTIAVNIKTPENMASIFRVADAAGCKNILLVDCLEIYNSRRFEKIARATEKFLNITQLTIDEFIRMQTEYQPLYAVEITSSSTNIFQNELPDKCSFVIGNERHGISKKILDICKTSIHIPMFGNNGSMNVSHALILVLYEWRRQKKSVSNETDF